MIPSPKRQMFFVYSGNSKTLKHFDLRGKVAAVNEQAIIMEQLEALKTIVMQIHADNPCIKEPSLLVSGTETGLAWFQNGVEAFLGKHKPVFTYRPR